MKVKLNGNSFFEVSAPYGNISSIHPKGHTGLDLVMNEGTKLFSPTNGYIEKIVDYGNNNIGKGIIIKTDSGENLILGHLSDTSAVEVGQSVNMGDYLALSGNTGRSTGAHLHLGVKDASGNFINPENYVLDEKELSALQKFFQNGQIGVDDEKYGEGLLGLVNDNGIVPLANGDTGFIESVKSLHQFSQQVGEVGFFRALYGKSFFEVTISFLKELSLDIFNFLLSNGDIFFLLPSILIMFATFMVGKNKYTKFIIPLWFFYFVSVVLNIQINL